MDLSYIDPHPSTVFGKHCECNAQKCAPLKRLPPLATHLLLLSHCVLTQHEGQKKKSKQHDWFRESNRRHTGIQNMRLSTTSLMQSNPMGRTFQKSNALFELQITTCAENGKIQLTPKITNDLFTCSLNCTCKSNPVCLIQQWSVIFLWASYVQWHYFLVWAYEN